MIQQDLHIQLFNQSIYDRETFFSLARSQKILQKITIYLTFDGDNILKSDIE